MSLKRFLRPVLGLALLAPLWPAASRAAGATPEIRPFRAIQQVFSQSCAFSSCHSALARKGGLVLDQEDLSYRSLVERASEHPEAAAAGLLRVASGDPANSFLMKKLRGQGPGDPMPQGAGALSPDILFMIDDWIRRGAHTTAEECPSATASGELAPRHGTGTAATICDDAPPPGDYVWKPEEPLPPPPAGEGLQLHVPQKVVEPGTEWEYCFAFRPDFSKVRSRAISRQEYRMNEGSHHLLLYMYFGDHPEQFAEGFYPCSAGNCTRPGDCPSDSSSQMPIGGSQVAGTAYQVNYPPGVGLPVFNSRNAVIIANLHYNNPFQPAQQIHSEAWMNLYFHKQGDFKAQLDGIFAVNYDDLVVEPFATRTISRIWKPRSLLYGSDSDAAVFQLFGHMHKRGREFNIDFVDNPCEGDCNGDNEVTVDEVVTGVNIALGTLPTRNCRMVDLDGDGQVTVDELITAVNLVVSGCQREPETPIYRTTSWDMAPVQEYPSPYLLVNRNQGLRWTCTHENGRKLPDGTEDPTFPPKKCHEGCEACGWDDASRTCVFTRDGSNRVYREGEAMPLVFGSLADDDMCIMFGYFLDQAALPLLEP